MSERLLSVTVSEFRSIRGAITVPLDAPVVLIHGPNGVGKTSILSAIELALTGEVPSLARVDREYTAHLVHKKASQAKVTLATSTLGEAELTVTGRSIAGVPLLQRPLSRFYSERCYLAQSALTRLLEIYQHKDTRRTDSPLTQFVKDLLGLDQLDALIEGLHPAGDIRRLRSPAPQYFEIRDEIRERSKQIAALQTLSLQLSSSLYEVETRLKGKLASLEANLDHLVANLDQLLPRIRLNTDDQKLLDLARTRRDIVATREEWQAISATIGAEMRAQREEEARVARAFVEQWRAGPGRKLEILVTELSGYFSDLPSSTATNPEFARNAAARSVTKELQRCDSLLKQDAIDAKHIADLDQGLQRARARLLVFDEQSATLSIDAGSLAQALAGIAPHVHTEDCPVCSRDFGEVSKRPLQAHLSNRIAQLTAAAGRLQVLSRERVLTSTAVAELERVRAQSQSRLLSDETRNFLKSRQARLGEVYQQLAALNDDIVNGMNLINRASIADRQLDELRSRSQRAETLQSDILSLAQRLDVSFASEASTAEKLSVLQATATQREEGLSKRILIRQDAIKETELLRSLRVEIAGTQNRIEEATKSVSRLERAKADADDLMTAGRQLLNTARDVRTDIVRRVFNDTLNAVWRDLFVRLAPEEQFVPAFALPEGPGSVEAVLETIYRSGGRGGNPRAMLSAGNLNTAALTLFLALHLSVNEQLNWLVIDDPVQSMDEVHIAQFAALLRTLSKEHGRQIILSIHERALFEYLSLELSPAFSDDRLITIELGQAPDGRTTMNYEPIIWEPDSAVAA